MSAALMKVDSTDHVVCDSGIVYPDMVDVVLPNSGKRGVAVNADGLSINDIELASGERFAAVVMSRHGAAYYTGASADELRAMATACLRAATALDGGSGLQ